jgi:hypothetical protein
MDMVVDSSGGWIFHSIAAATGEAARQDKDD